MKPILSVLAVLVVLSPHVSAQFNSTLTDWITTENITARGRIFANIGSKGEFASDGDPGAVVAAPSTAYPNYYYQIRLSCV